MATPELKNGYTSSEAAPNVTPRPKKAKRELPPAHVVQVLKGPGGPRLWDNIIETKLAEPKRE